MLGEERSRQGGARGLVGRLVRRPAGGGGGVGYRSGRKGQAPQGCITEGPQALEDCKQRGDSPFRLHLYCVNIRPLCKYDDLQRLFYGPSLTRNEH